MRDRIAKIRSLLGWQGMLGCALIAAAVFLDLNLMRPLEDRLHAAETTLAAKARKALGGAMAGGALDVARFQSYFRDGGDITASLAKLYDVAESKGLKLDSAEYSVREERELGLEGYEIVFPVSGSYARVREFAQAALDRMPVASLDTMRLARKRVNDAQVDAELRFTFYHVPR